MNAPENINDLKTRITDILASLPESIWHSSFPATYFKISNNVAQLVAENYAASEGELVFCYKNQDGYISIQQIYPPKTSDAA